MHSLIGPLFLSAMAFLFIAGILQFCTMGNRLTRRSEKQADRDVTARGLFWMALAVGVAFTLLIGAACGVMILLNGSGAGW